MGSRSLEAGVPDEPVVNDYPNSVLAGLPRSGWDSDTSVAYEVALEMIGQAMAAHTAAIEQERARPAPDPDRIGRWTAGRIACVTERDNLRATDDDAVARVGREYPALARTVRDQTR
jgi:hypothetical protein